MALVKSDFTEFLRNAGRNSMAENRAVADKTSVAMPKAAKGRVEKEVAARKASEEGWRKLAREKAAELDEESRSWGPNGKAKAKARLQVLLKDPKYRRYFDPDRTDPDVLPDLNEADRRAVRYYYMADDPEIKEPDISDEFYNKYEGEDL